MRRCAAGMRALLLCLALGPLASCGCHAVMASGAGVEAACREQGCFAMATALHALRPSARLCSRLQV